jgi:glyoxylase-like metal-dependent hydrolase (beta-lactamase superfamily II)
MPLSHRLGTATVVALHDGEGPFFQPRTEAFPGATERHWRLADECDPAAVTDDGRWLLRFRCFGIRFDNGPMVLVDAGIGPTDSPAASWAPVPGRLPDELAAAGIEPDDVDVVVITHLHTDHIGWAVTGRGGTPYFRNARYLMQRAEADAIRRFAAPAADYLLDPLIAAGQLSMLDGDEPLAHGLRVVATPGHTPGHQSVLLETAQDALLLTGDLLVHAVQLVAPEVAYAHEMDQDTARESRATLLRELAARPSAILATSHLSEPFLRLAGEQPGVG